jgi:hypothetical protein
VQCVITEEYWVREIICRLPFLLVQGVRTNDGLKNGSANLQRPDIFLNKQSFGLYAAASRPATKVYCFFFNRNMGI